MKVLINFILLILVIGVGCHGVNKKDDKSKKIFSDSSNDTIASAAKPEELKKVSFFDSVLNKYDLTWEQMKLHTILDSYFYTPNSEFAGDTIYNNNNKSIVIIQYKIGVVCEYKIIFIFQSSPILNTDFKVFQTNCDLEPTEEGHVSTSFDIVNDTILVKEVSHKKFNANAIKSITTEEVYIINDNGKLVLQNNKH